LALRSTRATSAAASSSCARSPACATSGYTIFDTPARTLLLAQGVAPRVVMETLGHSGISLTMNTYTHVLPVLQRDAAAKMDDVLGA
jgi:integrase